MHTRYGPVPSAKMLWLHVWTLTTVCHDLAKVFVMLPSDRERQEIPGNRPDRTNDNAANGRLDGAQRIQGHCRTFCRRGTWYQARLVDVFTTSCTLMVVLAPSTLAAKVAAVFVGFSELISGPSLPALCLVRHPFSSLPSSRPSDCGSWAPHPSHSPRLLVLLAPLACQIIDDPVLGAWCTCRSSPGTRTCCWRTCGTAQASS